VVSPELADHVVVEPVGRPREGMVSLQRSCPMLRIELLETLPTRSSQSPTSSGGLDTARIWPRLRRRHGHVQHAMIAIPPPTISEPPTADPPGHAVSALLCAYDRVDRRALPRSSSANEELGASAGLSPAALLLTQSYRTGQADVCCSVRIGINASSCSTA